MRSLILLALAFPLAACSMQVDTSGQTQVFDVGQSTAMCPAGLFERASESLALCTHPPESCTQSGASSIECTCMATTGSTQGTWECHEATTPPRDGGAD